MRYGTSHRYKRIWLRLLRFLLVIILLIFCSIFFYQNAAKDHHYKAEIGGDDSNSFTGNQTFDSVADHLISENVLLLCLEDGENILDIKGEEKIFPASMTKIMTAIIAIENLSSLDQRIVLQEDIFTKLYQEDASMAGFLPGEEVMAIDLLYGVLLPSGAECCIGLADYLAGSEAAYVDLMNVKAGALGMEQTHFTNSTGLHDPDHYTTAADLAILLKYALQNDTFTEIFTTDKYSNGATDLHPDGITMYSTLFKNLEEYGIQSSILGGKTGYTSEAGLCLASYAKISGKRYIMITANAKGNHTTEQYNIMDAVYAYQQLEQSDPASASVHR